MALILTRGRGTFLAKVDIEQAYMNTRFTHRTGNYAGKYVSGCLPFGLKSAPKIFLAVAVIIGQELSGSFFAYGR